MITQHFKIAVRNLWKNKGYSLLNISGLAIGMAAAMLILAWVQNETSFDMFHAKRDRLYMAVTNLKLNSEINTMQITPKPMAPALKSEIPGIANASRYSEMGDVLMTVDSKKLKSFGVFVDSTFLQMFDLPLIQGDPHKALKGPSDIVVTRTLAQRLFGSDDVLGKTIRLDTTKLSVLPV